MGFRFPVGLIDTEVGRQSVVPKKINLLIRLLTMRFEPTAVAQFWGGYSRSRYIANCGSVLEGMRLGCRLIGNISRRWR